MSFDFKKSLSKSVEITPKKIRSKYRLRLMNRLAENQETVSELAKSVGLRMPHASAEIKRMRYEKLVSSDLEIGSRGAKIRLTEEGIKVIKEFYNNLNDWKNMTDLIPKNFRNSKTLSKTGNAGIFSGSLELAKEGNISIKQDNLFEDIYIKKI